MPEEQAFCVLVSIMSEYGLRDLFRQGFEELHLKFYQLERLIQVLPDLLTLLYKYCTAILWASFVTSFTLPFGNLSLIGLALTWLTNQCPSVL